MTKYTVHEDVNCLFQVELVDDWLLMHVEVKQWSVKIFKEMINIFADFENKMYKLGYSKLATVTPNPKFAKMFGGSTVKQFTVQGQQVEAIVWELKSL